MCTHVHTHICTHTHMHTHTYAHTHTHTHTHTEAATPGVPMLLRYPLPPPLTLLTLQKERPRCLRTTLPLPRQLPPFPPHLPENIGAAPLPAHHVAAVAHHEQRRQGRRQHQHKCAQQEPLRGARRHQVLDGIKDLRHARTHAGIRQQVLRGIQHSRHARRHQATGAARRRTLKAHAQASGNRCCTASNTQGTRADTRSQALHGVEHSRRTRRHQVPGAARCRTLTARTQAQMVTPGAITILPHLCTRKALPACKDLCHWGGSASHLSDGLHCLVPVR